MKPSPLPVWSRRRLRPAGCVIVWAESDEMDGTDPIDARHREGVYGCGSDWEPAGLLRVSAPRAFARRHLVPVMSMLCREHARLSIDLDDTDSVPACDINFSIAESSPGLVEQGQPVAVLRSVLCATSLRLDDARSEGVVALHLQRAASNVYLDWEAELAAVLEGRRIARLPLWLAHEALASGTLVAFGAMRAERAPARLLVTRYRGPRTDANVTTFLTRLRHVFGAPPYWDRAAPVPALNGVTGLRRW